MNIKNLSGKTVGASIALLSIVIGLGSADGQTNVIAYQVDAPSVGVQTYGGSLGMDFEVISTIFIKDLGVFDSSQNGLSRDLTAQLWSRGGTPALVPGGQLSFTSADPGTLIGGSRFKPLASPLELAPGDYTIVAYGYGSNEPNGNLGGPLNKSINDGGGLILFEGTSRFGNAGVFPTIIDGGPVNRYAAGTFRFSNVIPEPCCSVLIGLLALASAARRGHRS